MPPAFALAERPRAEFFTGFEASDNYVSGHVGGGYAFGKGLHAESLRLRAVGSFGHDPNNAVQGSELGARFLAENWIDLSGAFYLSVDAAYGTAFQDYWSRARVGYRFRPRLLVGLEGGALGNEEYDAARTGGFVRFDLLDTELTLAGGFSGNYLLDNPSGYVSLAVHRAF